MDTRTVYVVTYQDRDSDEPVVTIFDNEASANDCARYMKTYHNRCYTEPVPVYSKFSVSDIATK